MLDKDLSFSTGFVASKRLVVIAAEQDNLINRKPHSILFFLQDGKWQRMSIDWPVVSVCVAVDGTLLSLGVDGHVHVAGRSGVSVETISANGNGPESVGVMSQIRTIDGVTLAIGMGRQVYLRNADGVWSRFDFDSRQALEEGSVSGFLSIDGLTRADIYAVGFSGEIWHHDGKAWSQMESPTNVNLNSVRCVHPKDVYIGGQSGVLLKGARNQWEVICKGEVTDDIWGVEVFMDRIYVSTSKNVFAVDGNRLQKLDIGCEQTGAASKLHASDGVLWSFGTKFLAYTADGLHWSSATIPRS